MNHRICIAIPFIIGFLFSCKKDKRPTVTTATVTYDNYTALKPGNYWIYQD